MVSAFKSGGDLRRVLEKYNWKNSEQLVNDLQIYPDGLIRLSSGALRVVFQIWHLYMRNISRFQFQTEIRHRYSKLSILFLSRIHFEEDILLSGCQVWRQDDADEEWREIDDKNEGEEEWMNELKKRKREMIKKKVMMKKEREVQNDE